MIPTIPLWPHFPSQISEKVWKDKVHKQNDIIKSLGKQVVELETRVQAYKTNVDQVLDHSRQYKEAQSIINSSNEKTIDHLKTVAKKAINGSLCKEDILGSEIQWDAATLTTRVNASSGLSNKDPEDVPHYIEALEAECRMYRERYEIDTMALQTKIADAEG